MTFNPKDYVMDMRGKDYLEVKWRIVWFRETHPRGSIMTEIISADPLVIKATVTDEDNRILATGLGTPKTQGVAAKRPFEGAETAAIGRALAVAGFGTQFTGEDEGEHIADSPVERKTADVPPTNGADAEWKEPALGWMVKEKHAKNRPRALEIWKLLKLDECTSKAQVVTRVELYRKNKDEANQETQVAAEHAIAGNDLTA